MPFLGNGTPLRFESGGSLYINTPTRPGQKVLLMWEVEGVDRAEPLAWTFSRSDGGRTFYTSLGHVSDFEQAGFNEMLARAVAWCVEKPEGQ